MQDKQHKDDEKQAYMCPINLPHSMDNTGCSHKPARVFKNFAKGDGGCHSRAKNKNLGCVRPSKAGWNIEREEIARQMRHEDNKHAYAAEEIQPRIALPFWRNGLC